MARCLITGVTGQDGWYLSEQLLESGHTVVGVCSPGDAARVPDGVQVVTADLRDFDSLADAIATGEPDQVYNLAALSSVAMSWAEPDLVADVNGTGVIRLLRALVEWAERAGRQPAFVQAGSSEIFGNAPPAQDETTPLAPVNPYGLAKATAHRAVTMFRERGVRASNVILFNHESPRRPPQFVTRRITQGVARILTGRAEVLELGDLDAVRDWGYAPDYMRAMSLAAAHDTPGDYVVASGQVHSVRDFVTAAFAHVGIEDWAPHVRVDPALVRPAEPNPKIGDASRAAAVLGWRPTLGFAELVAMMTDSDVDLERAAHSNPS